MFVKGFVEFDNKKIKGGNKMKSLKDIVVSTAEDNCKIRIRFDRLNNVLFKCSCFLYTREVLGLIEILEAMQRYCDAERNSIEHLNWLKGNLRSAGIEFQSRNNLITVKYRTWIIALKNALK